MYMQIKEFICSNVGVVLQWWQFESMIFSLKASCARISLDKMLSTNIL